MFRPGQQIDIADDLAMTGNGDSQISRETEREMCFGKTILPDSEYLTLARTIESEIIPRLLLAHRFESFVPPGVRPPEVYGNQDSVSEFTRIVLKQETDVAFGYVSALLARGISLEVLFLELLAPTARRLGEMWVSDDCHFTEVTIALCRLQQLLREFSHVLGHETDHHKLGFRVLLAPVPSDQHTFGILMVEEFFRRSGWNVFGIPSATAKEIVDAVRQEWFALVGLSMSCDDYSGKLAALIKHIRKVSRNRSVVIMVGGRFFNENPEQAMLLGADATAIDGHEAIVQSQRFIRLVDRRN